MHAVTLHPESSFRLATESIVRIWPCEQRSPQQGKVENDTQIQHPSDCFKNMLYRESNVGSCQSRARQWLSHTRLLQYTFAARSYLLSRNSTACESVPRRTIREQIVGAKMWQRELSSISNSHSCFGLLRFWLNKVRTSHTNISPLFVLSL